MNRWNCLISVQRFRPSAAFQLRSFEPLDTPENGVDTGPVLKRKLWIECQTFDSENNKSRVLSTPRNRARLAVDAKLSCDVVERPANRIVVHASRSENRQNLSGVDDAGVR